MPTLPKVHMLHLVRCKDLQHAAHDNPGVSSCHKRSLAIIAQERRQSWEAQKGRETCHGSREGRYAGKTAQHSRQLSAGAPVGRQVAQLIDKPRHTPILPCNAQTHIAHTVLTLLPKPLMSKIG